MTCRSLHIVLLLLGLVFGINAAQGQISVSVPSHVAAGENFRLAYTINTQDVEDFRAGNIPEGLEVIAGPYTSQQSSYQMVNGHTSSSSSITFTYTLYAVKHGTYKIPGAHVFVNGRKITSRPVTITVVGNASSGRGAQSPNNYDNDAGPAMKASGSRISGNDLFIRVSANKSSVHEQEPVLLTYKDRKSTRLNSSHQIISY